MQKFVILLGPPGSGKGTFFQQLQRLYPQKNFVRFAPGEALRAEIAAQSEIGRQVDAIIQRGDLVPVDFVAQLFTSFSKAQAPDTLIFLDGFPRSMEQANLIQDYCKNHNAQVQSMILFELDESILFGRITQRAAAEARSDDAPDVMKHRLDVFHKETQPLIALYQTQARHFNASLPPDDPARLAFIQDLVSSI